eukprot:2573580-Rhodomonas_salina.2
MHDNNGLLQVTCVRTSAVNVRARAHCTAALLPTMAAHRIGREMCRVRWPRAHRGFHVLKAPYRLLSTKPCYGPTALISTREA